MAQLARLARILAIALRFGLHEFFPQARGVWVAAFLARLTGAELHAPRAERLRRALEVLGPIFVKFGQVLSTRRDLLPADIADELAKLQDRVPPFPPEQAIAEIERSMGRRIDQVFLQFERDAVASASIAQVHFGLLRDGTPGGREVAVKVLRPGVEEAIAHDVALLETAAALIERLWVEGRRLKPRQVVAEFAHHLEDELDLVREAANASQLARNFRESPTLAVPEIYWDYCTRRVMTMQRMHGTPISQVDELRAKGVDISRLARAGVEIFFTQVFRDGFFHADMHPGNIFVKTDGELLGQYIALDFGIMGTLSDVDKNYLAQNFLAFFNRDYHRVAQAHVEAGWVPAETRIDEFEAAIRAVSEPIFARPLKEIYFGRLLLRLFQTSRRFNVEIQPQLVLLQKTLLNIEGLGRELDSDLDLWQTAKPYLERWMTEQIGWRALLRTVRREAPYWATTLPQVPRLAHRMLAEDRLGPIHRVLEQMRRDQARRDRLLLAILAVLAVGMVLQIGRVFG